MKKKYKLTNDIFVYHGTKLYRIKALKDFDDVSKGQLGGYIESEKIFHMKEIVGCMIMLWYIIMLLYMVML